MAFDWLKYIDVAADLRQFNNEESIRSGVSRAYYATYGKARIFCINQSIFKHSEIPTNGVGFHKKLISELKNSDHPDLYEIGARMDTLRIRRNEADYDAQHTDYRDSKLLDNSISLAKEVIKFIKDYTP